MSFYRTLLAAVCAALLVAPVFADDTNTTSTTGTDSSMTTQPTTSDTSGSMSSGSTSSTDSMTTDANTKVNLNKATAKDLMKVKGLNASKARAIVAYRKKHGDFKSVEDLTNVKMLKKMKPDTLRDIQSQLSVD